MSDSVIKVSNLSKSYFLGHQSTGKQYTALRDVISQYVHNLLRTTRDLVSGKQIVQGDEVEEFWALKDVSFEVKQGEVLGIIGRNGAGKSTLLKILSRITEPTEGRIEIAGRVASLLEVGSGFHPELSGRENVFLNGAILGMSRAEIKRKFNEIVEFAEVEKFLDTPVKRYSSGMYMRLAFAVAAHLEPEILIVDEVLAVGDAAFQKKCLGKMQDVGKSGKTVLFVSHNMDAVLRLCSHAILLHKGSIIDAGQANEVVNRYATSHVTQNSTILFSDISYGKTVRDNLVLVDMQWPTTSLFSPWSIPFGEKISFIIRVKCLQPVQGVELGIAIYSPSGTEIASTSSVATLSNVIMTPGEYNLEVDFNSFNLVPNHYMFGLGVKSEAGQEQHYPQAFTIDVIPSELSSRHKTDTFWGYVVPEVTYKIHKKSSI